MSNQMETSRAMRDADMNTLKIAKPSNQAKGAINNEYLKYNVGETLKNLRLSNNLTQKHVARANGLSPAMISLIERNNISASITTLSKLMKFYGVKMSWLFDENNATNKYEVIRKNERRPLSKIFAQNGTCSGYVYFCEALLQMKRKKMLPYVITLSDDIVGDNFFVHCGESFMYVLKGNFELTVGCRRVVLAEGDSVYLDASMEHGFHSTDGSEVMVLVVKMTA
jgi:transcriptional regulator with XRE-family HTH domain